MTKLKASCTSLDCPEITGGECRHQNELEKIIKELKTRRDWTGAEEVEVWFEDKLNEVFESGQAQAHKHCIERVEKMRDYYGASPRQKGVKNYPLEMNAHIEGYNQALDDVIKLIKLHEIV